MREDFLTTTGDEVIDKREESRFPLSREVQQSIIGKQTIGQIVRNTLMPLVESGSVSVHVKAKDFNSCRKVASLKFPKHDCHFHLIKLC